MKLIKVDKNNDIYKNKISYPSTFAKTLNNKYIFDLEKEIADNCIKEKSLYDQSEKINKDGLKICVLKKGTFLFKAMKGFIPREKELKYLNKNNNELIWFGNKYIAYNFALQVWGGINVYELKEDIYLFDYYDINNLSFLFKFITEKTNNQKLIEYIKTISGYKMSKQEQYNKLMKITNWTELWIHDEEIKIPYSIRYCNTYSYNDLNPIMRVKGSYYNDKFFLNNVIDLLNKSYNLDGIIRKQVKSTIEFYGSTFEEIVIPAKNVLAKLNLVTSHPLHWTTLNLDYLNIPKEGFIMIEDAAVKNDNFAQYKFYFQNNKCTFPELKFQDKSITVLSYNVHGWQNINADINIEQNFKNNINLIKRINANLVFLQEVTTRNIKKNRIIDEFNNLGYRYNVFAKNGAPVRNDKDSYVVFFSKIPIEDEKIIDITVAKYRRTVPIIVINNIKIAGVHLEIGKRFHTFAEESKQRNEIIKQNNNLRINELSKILEQKPEIIIGDFNFTQQDPESSFLRKEKNYGLVDDNNQNTTPFNRTDHIFINKQSQIRAINNITVKCNYSDHLPIIIQLINQSK